MRANSLNFKVNLQRCEAVSGDAVLRVRALGRTVREIRLKDASAYPESRENSADLCVVQLGALTPGTVPVADGANPPQKCTSTERFATRLCFRAREELTQSQLMGCKKILFWSNRCSTLTTTTVTGG